MRMGWFAVAALAVLHPLVGQAATGTCTITRCRQPTVNLGLLFVCSPAVGLPMPISFDETTGVFTMARDAWYAEFGDVGAQFATGFGPDAFLRMYNGTETGTIDANGNILLKDFDIENSTSYQFPDCPTIPDTCPDYPITQLDAATGVQVRVLSGKPYVMEGTPLNFTTGAVELNGSGFLQSAVGASGVTLSGLDITCTLNPIPDQTKLPAGATITKLGGKSKVDASAEGGDKGDKLTLKATLTPGAQPFDLSGAAPVIVRLGELTLVVRGGNATVKGRQLVVKRDDACKVKKGATEGVCKADRVTTCKTFADCEAVAKLEVLSGQKAVESARSQVGGQLSIANGKKGATLNLKLQGLDLAALTGAQELRVAVGTATARKAVTVSSGAIR